MRCHLFIDADDTLWENNIYFERSIHDFITFLNHSRLSADEVREILDEVERGAGYGSASFAESLVETYRRLAERDPCDEDITRIRALGERIQSQPVELLDGVRETLIYLSARHHILMLTKGDVDEQTLKVERSGIRDLFRQVVIVAEKDVATYRSLVDDLSADLDRTWMIGNSPRSDINPARAAGLNTVYIPHPHTWRLEHEEIQDAGSGRTLTLETFAHLRNYF